jgi:hypothetical protein
MPAKSPFEYRYHFSTFASTLLQIVGAGGQKRKEWKKEGLKQKKRI